MNSPPAATDNHNKPSPDRSNRRDLARADGVPGRVSGGRKYRDSAEIDQLVMDLLRSSGRPLGAYAIAQQSRNRGSALAPNQVYRSLDRLIARSEACRVELLNAYMPAPGCRGAIMLCRSCGGTAILDISPLIAALAPLCDAAGFLPGRFIVESAGRCANCIQNDAGGVAASDIHPLDGSSSADGA